MNQRHTVLFLIVSIILISACNRNQTDVTGPYKGGTDGLMISFEANAPPSRFDVGENVPARVLLNNKGEFDLEQGEAEVQLFGVHRPSFGIPETYTSNSGDISGVSDFLETGGEQEVDLGNINYGQAIANSETFTLRARVCYPYETNAQINACISSINIEEGKGEQVCSISEEKVAKGSVSSAPVQVTSFTEEFRGADKIVFNIVVENKGVGTVYAPTSECSQLDDPDFRVDNENIVLFTISPSDIECQFSLDNGNTGEIRLRDKIANIVCQKEVTETDSSFEQKILVNLRYKYLDSTSTNFEIFEII